jgi:hypothetical protein
MAEIDRYYSALQNAHAAGDTEAARQIAARIKAMRSQPEPSTMQNLAQGAGDLAAGVVRGAGSIGATLMTPFDALARSAGIENSFIGRRDRRQAMDGGLQELGADPNSMMYKTGKIGGEIAGTAGAGGAIANTLGRLAPAIANAPLLQSIASSGMRAGDLGGKMGMATRALGGATTGGVAAGMIDPETAGTGALLGGALPPVLAGAGRLGSALRQGLGGASQQNELAKQAINQYGIPLGIADTTSSKAMKALRSVLNDAPLIGGVGARQNELKQEAFNRAVGGTFGAAEKKLTPSVVDQAKKRMGDEFDRIWNNNALKVDESLVSRMMQLENQAKKLPQSEGASLSAEIRDLYSKMIPDNNGGLMIDGATANKFQSYLRRRAEGSSGLKNELSDLRQNIISSFNRSVSPQDAAALTMNRTQYKAFKTVEPLLNKGEVGVAGREAGDIPAALLPSAVAKSYQNAAGTPLADLSKIGSRFLVDRVAQTGGSTRAAIQNSAIGGAIGMGAMSNPSTLFALPAAYGVNSMMGSPALARRMINAPQGLLQLPEELQQFGYQSLPALSGNFNR